MTRRPGEVQRARDACELRQRGLSFQQIADQLGYANPSSARRAVLRGQKLLAVDAQPKRHADVRSPASSVSDNNVWLDVYAPPVSGIDFGDRLLGSIFQRRAW